MATWTEPTIAASYVEPARVTVQEIKFRLEKFYFEAPIVTKESVTSLNHSRSITLGSFIYQWGIPRNLNEVIRPLRDRRFYYWHN